MPEKTVSILGSTGSVGRGAAEVIAAHPGRFRVQALTAMDNAALLARQALDLRARAAVIGNEAHYGALRDLLAGSGIEVAAGRAAVLEAAGRPCDLCVAAIAGFAGLEPIMAAIAAGADIALANKEPLAAAGPLVCAAARERGVRILPLDSEHNAVFQVFDEAQRAGIVRIILTASGGPFRTWDAARMAQATPEQAVAHPNWSMGRKISVDSATMMNKGLEVIEAHYLFGMAAEAIDVLVHPQSIVHSMVEYRDGSVLAQMGAPDMRTPIAHCLGLPERIDTPGARLDLTQRMNLSFEPVDRERFPAIDLSYECLKAGPAHCVALNAANEAAVAAFLDKRAGFSAIVAAAREAVEKTQGCALNSVADVVAFDKTVRERTEVYIKEGKDRKGVYAA